ncbi:MAG: alpha/beta hydrolase [Anaerolineae bacterium]|nr:alpha/beta hydrolase [Anaerolineae bacterium]
MKDEQVMAGGLPKASAFEPQFIEVLAVQTAYVTTGKPDGRPVVLLHGMSSSADNYRETMHVLAESRWLIAPDIPGFGLSEETQPYTMVHLVEWLAAFREALDLPPMDLVGHSFGGALATSFALSYPEDVASLLLSAPALLAAVGYPEFVKKMMIWLRLPESGTAVSQSNRVVQQAVRNSSFAPEQFDDDVWERRVLEYHHARSSAEVLKALAFYDVRPDLPRLQQPVCIVWGENDPVLSVSDVAELEALLSQVEVHRLPECGHIVMLEKFEEFIEIAQAFWGKERLKIED